MRRWPRLASIALLIFIIAAGLYNEPTQAGPAHYDKDSKAFRFTYTFAVLPGGGGDPQLGQVQKPSAQQEQVVNNLVGQVSELLFSVTGGRAKIGSLDYVDNVKNADIVVSLTGAPASAGYANLRAIEGQPGQIVLYYQTLEPMIKQDVVFTATHELCHYVFGLTDEYVFPRGCPVRSGAACLMDNYFSSSRGFMGRFCSPSEHDAEPAQQASCQEIVDQFFQKLGVEAEKPNATTVAAAGASTTPDPRAAIVASAIGKVRSKYMESTSKGKITASLATFARDTLKSLIDKFNQDNPNPFIISRSGESQILDMILKAGQMVPIFKPEYLGAKAFSLIVQEAKRLAESVRDVKSESSRLSKIKGGLRSYVSELVKSKQIDSKAFAPSQQTALIDQIARTAARDPSLQSLDRLVGLTEISVQIDLAIAQDVVTVLDELNVPGTRIRRDFFAGLQNAVEKNYSIPGRNFSRFGTRRTRIITPEAGPSDEYVLTQAGVFPYSSIRDRSIVQFSRLVNRSGKLQLVSPVNHGGGFQPLTARISRPFKDIPTEDASTVAPDVNIQEVITDTIDQLQRNRLENISVLIPPGGLQIDLGVQIPVIRSQLPKDTDVRFDLVLVGPAELSTEVRDLALSTRGSVLTATDVDEIGAIAQRLKDEQTSGNWVVIPQQATLLKAPDPEKNPPAPKTLEASLENLKNICFAPKTGEPSKDWKGPTTVGEISKRLGEAEKRLDSILALDGKPSAATDGKPNPVHLEDEERKTIQDAIRALRWLRDVTNIEPGKDKTKSDPSKKDSSDTENLAAFEVASLAQIDNRRAMPILGRAREQLNRLRRSLDKMRLPSGGFANTALTVFAKELTEETEKQKASSEPSPSKSVPTLGANLRYVEAVLRAYEHVFEASLISQHHPVPIYKRIDRIGMEKMRRAIEDAKRQASLGLVNTLPSLEGYGRIRLARFYAEGQAEFELIVGLSHELPGRHDIEPSKRFHLELISDLGVRAADDAMIRFDQNTSTPSLLVFRASTPQPLRPGWYTPVLVFDDHSDFAYLEGAEANFTFSVGSDRPNIQLIAGLVQAPGTTSRGIIKRSESYAVVEVQVSAPNSVINAHIEGYYQMLTKSFEPIDPRSVDFRDDGTDAKGLAPGQPGFDPSKCDRAANDGIYTAFLPLADVTMPTEYRIFIQADTTDGKARYISLDNPNSEQENDEAGGQGPQDKRVLVQQVQATKAAEGSVLKFQRATSFHFRAEP